MGEKRRGKKKVQRLIIINYECLDTKAAKCSDWKKKKREREVLGSIKEARFVWKETDISCIKWSNLSRWIQSRGSFEGSWRKTLKNLSRYSPPPPLFPFRCVEDFWCQFLARRIGRKLPVGKYSSLMHKVWLSGYRDWTVPLCSLIRFWKWKNRSTVFLVKLSWQRGNYAKRIVRSEKDSNVRFSITGMTSRKQRHVKWNLPFKFKRRRICYIYIYYICMKFERNELMEFLMLVSFPSWFILELNWRFRFFSQEKKIYLLTRTIQETKFFTQIKHNQQISIFWFYENHPFTLLYFSFF